MAPDAVKIAVFPEHSTVAVLATDKDGTAVLTEIASTLVVRHPNVLVP